MIKKEMIAMLLAGGQGIVHINNMTYRFQEDPNE